MKPLAKLGVGCAVIFVTRIGGVGVLVFRMASANEPGENLKKTGTGSETPPAR